MMRGIVNAESGFHKQNNWWQSLKTRSHKLKSVAEQNNNIPDRSMGGSSQTVQ